MDDDMKSMSILIQSLRMQRTDAEGKKDKQKKDKTLALNGLLEENKNAQDAVNRKDLLTDIKIVKTQQQAMNALNQAVGGSTSKKPKQVLSDISQITQQ